MPAIPLKSKFGCLRCREKRRKCDEGKPNCGDCARKGLVCEWNTPLVSKLARAKAPEAAGAPPRLSSDAGKMVAYFSRADLPVEERRARELGSQQWQILAFDSPSVLRTHAVPDNGTIECKEILQYLSERGTSLLRYPPDRQGRDLNPFRAGFQMASLSTPNLNAYLCIGAGHLSRIDPVYGKIALRQYTTVMLTLRKVLNADPEKPPAEWITAVAALLAFYELLAFNSPRNRMAHLVGFHRLVEARLSHQLPWSPLKILLEQYIHSLVLGSLFHTELLVGRKSITYVDGIIDIINSGPEPREREIAGVPEDLTAVVYKLAILNTRDVNESPWDAEIFAITSRLRSWEPARDLLSPSASGLLLIARMYHYACSCLAQVVSDRKVDATHEAMAVLLQEASDLLRTSPVRFRPFSSLIWPLTILSILAVDPLQRRTFKQPISFLANETGIKGYCSILSFLKLIENDNSSSSIFLRPDLLSLIHM